MFTRATTSQSMQRTIHTIHKQNFSTITKSTSRRAIVNQIYEPQSKPIPELKPTNNASTHKYTENHNEQKWNDDTILESLNKHCLMAWGATDTMMNNAAKVIRSSDGPYLFDSHGKKYIDLSSQAVCVNLGHSMPTEVQNAINAQIKETSFLYGGLAVSEIRARLSSLLAQICPGDINAFMFPSSGSEANEAAIRIARKYTGRNKILSRYRSYHGGTMGSLAMTGDSRRFGDAANVPGFIKVFDPYPMYFKWADDENEIAEKCLQSLHEQILLENPKDIAAIFIEPITGANGWLKPPIKYIQGVRALCDEYGILLMCDEVMAGFGRTGKMFSFEHFEGVTPDIMTFAKLNIALFHFSCHLMSSKKFFLLHFRGLTSSYVPLSGVGVSDKIMNHFRNTPLGYGSTFQSHPVALSCAYAVVKYLIDHNIVEHVKKMEKVIEKEMQSLIDDEDNVSVAQGRVYGMGGCIDLMNPETMDILCSTNEQHPKGMELKKSFNENGVISIIKGPVVHICPPLISQPEDIEYAFKMLKKSLWETFNE